MPGQERERRPTLCFSTMDAFGQHYLVYNIETEKVLKVLRVRYKADKLTVHKTLSFPNIVNVVPMLVCSGVYVRKME